MAKQQFLRKVLAVQFACLGTIEKGDVVVMSDQNTVAKVSSAGAVGIVGTVDAHEPDALVCTVRTRYREKRADRKAGATFSAPGAFVWDADGNAIPYNDASHDSAAIAGVVTKIPEETVSVTGTADGPFDVTTDSNDKLSIKVGGGSSQVIQLTQAEHTATAAAAEIDSGLTGATCVAVGDKIKITVDDPVKDLEIETVTNDAYTLLGLTVGVYAAATLTDVGVETLEL